MLSARAFSPESRLHIVHSPFSIVALRDRLEDGRGLRMTALQRHRKGPISGSQVTLLPTAGIDCAAVRAAIGDHAVAEAAANTLGTRLL
jgi:hypothetical protein